MARTMRNREPDVGTTSSTEPKVGRSDHTSFGNGDLATRERIRGILNRHPSVGLAVGVIRDGSSEFFTGTVSRISPRTPLSPRTRSSGSARSPRPSRRSL